MKTMPRRSARSIRAANAHASASRRHEDVVAIRDAEIARVLRRQVEGLATVERRGVAPALDARVVRLQPPPRRQEEGITSVGLFDGRIVLHDAEWRRRTAARRLPQTRVQELLAGMRLVGTRPLDAAKRFEA